MADAPAPRQIPNTIYDRMAFAEYEFREFPYAVPVVDGVVQATAYDAKHKAHPVVVVNSQEELDALKGGEAVLVPVAPNAVESASRIETEDDVRDRLYVQAEQAGARIDKRWSVERIEKAISEARSAVL